MRLHLPSLLPAVAIVLPACSGPAFCAAPTEPVLVVAQDEQMFEELTAADAAWEAVGVRAEAVEVLPPGSELAGAMPAEWRTRDQLDAKCGGDGTVGCLDRHGEGLLAAWDTDIRRWPPELVVLHELGHVLRGDHDLAEPHLPETVCETDRAAGIMCAGTSARALTALDAAFVLESW